MTLDEAIAKAKADGDVQLAEWLRQARGADAAARWYTEKLRDANRTIRKLLDESAKLLWLVNDMLACFRIGVEREGISKQWCYELFDTYAGKLRELGIEVGNGTE